MIEASLAGASSTRTLRGIGMFLERRHEVERRTRHEWGVPSCGGDEVYLVNTKLGTCSCKDHRRAVEQGEVCKHVVAARLTMQHRAELRARCKAERAKR